MHRFSCLAWLVLPALLAACGGRPEPALGEPLPLEIAATGQVTGPRFSSGPDDRLTLSWMEKVGDETSLRFATLENGQFGKPATVVTDTGMFVNWADLPSVMHVADQHWIAHWLRYSADKTYSYDVVVAQSFDSGTTWSDALPAHTDGTPTEHGFVSMHRAVEGVSLLWLDGRNTANERSENVLDTSMTLRSGVITPGGERLHEQLLDDSVCDCCQTDVAVAASGPVAVYRDRTADEIRDIYVTRNIDGAWQPGVRLFADNWKIPGCPVNGPSIVADGDDVAVAWFSAADNAPVVRVIRSSDAGASFGEPIQIAAGKLSGFVGLAQLPGGSLAVSWVSRDPEVGNVVNLVHIAADGTLGPVRRIGTSGQVRLFPQLGYQEGSLYIVWTDVTDEQRLLKAARIPALAP